MAQGSWSQSRNRGLYQRSPRSTPPNMLVPTQHPQEAWRGSKMQTVWPFRRDHWPPDLWLPWTKTEYIHRHNKAPAHMHWKICKEFGIEVKERQYEHEPKTVTEKDNVPILSNMPIHLTGPSQLIGRILCWRTRRTKPPFSLTWLYPSIPTPQSKPRKSLANISKDLEIEVERMWGSNNNGPGGLESPWHHQEGHGKLHQQNPWQHQHTWTPENNSPFYSPPSQADALQQVETLFASQSPWSGLGCW